MTRLATAADFDFFYGLYMHPETNRYLLYEPMSEAEFAPIFEELLSKNALFVYSDGVQDIGMFKIQRYGFRCEHVGYLGGVALRPEFFGSGHARKMLAEVLELVRSQGILRLELSTSTLNHRAIRLYESMGFEREGVMRKFAHLKQEGVFWDEVLMSWLA